MKRFIAAALACAALAGPARAEPETKTQLVAIDGRNVDVLVGLGVVVVLCAIYLVVRRVSARRGQGA